MYSSSSAESIVFFECMLSIAMKHYVCLCNAQSTHYALVIYAHFCINEWPNKGMLYHINKSDPLTPITLFAEIRRSERNKNKKIKSMKHTTNSQYILYYTNESWQLWHL